MACRGRSRGTTSRPRVALVDVPRISDGDQERPPDPSRRTPRPTIRSPCSATRPRSSACRASTASRAPLSPAAWAAHSPLGAYLTQQNGTPDLIGPKVSTEATKLAGRACSNRYQRASTYLATEAEIVMSDGSKMAELARNVRHGGIWNVKPARGDGHSWNKRPPQEIYKTLVPVAFPVLYNLGPGSGINDGEGDGQCEGLAVRGQRRLRRSQAVPEHRRRRPVGSGGTNDEGSPYFEPASTSSPSARPTRSAAIVTGVRPRAAEGADGQAVRRRPTRRRSTAIGLNKARVLLAAVLHPVPAGVPDGRRHPGGRSAAGCRTRPGPGGGMP